MKNFGYTFLACLTAIFASGILFFVIAILFFASMIASLSFQAPVSPVAPNSILRISLSEQISDNPSNYFLNSFDPYTMTVKRGMSMLQVVTAIEKAADDDRIKGIYLNISPALSIGLANAEEIREALLRFKDKEKFIISYSDYYSQLSYYLSSVADRIYMNPEGDLDWRGMSSQVMFFKGALDKLGVEAEIFRSGDFKSAVEPFMYDRMSPENRAQTTKLVTGIWGEIVSKVADAREIDSSLVQRYASALMINGAETALGSRLIDGAVHSDYVTQMLSDMSGGDGSPIFITLHEYATAMEAENGSRSRNKVAVIYAEGDIVDGRAREGEFGGHELAAKISGARKDDDIKAVVFRVNSPGGSALASEIIWNEISLLRAVKPVVVSMGNYAASGGYYIAAPADMIIANKSTVTGSIGVFGLMLNIEKPLKDKLGITVDVVRTNPSADLGSSFRAQTSKEKAYFQNRVEDVYSTFVAHVADGRNLSGEEVLKIAGGRVWSGLDSFELGLIDGYGGLRDAIVIAADRAGIANDFKIESGDNYTDSFNEIMKSLLNGSMFAGQDTPANELMKEYDGIMRMVQREGIQAMMPYRMIME